MSGRYLNLSEVADYLSVSRTTVQQLTRSGTLPQPIYLTPRLPRWDRQAVDAALASPPTTVAVCHDEIVRRVADEIAQGGRQARQATRRR